MGKLTGTTHGDQANELLAFYLEKASELEKSRQYFMAAIALALAVETAILTYLLVEFGDDNGGELKIPDSVAFAKLIDAANQIDVLNAPVNIPSHSGPDGSKARPKHVAKDAADKIKKFRNLIHPARALGEGFDPNKFTRKQLKEYKDMYKSVTHSLIYHI